MDKLLTKIGSFLSSINKIVATTLINREVRVINHNTPDPSTAEADPSEIISRIAFI
jgi:hypothetical protein